MAVEVNKFRWDSAVQQRRPCFVVEADDDRSGWEVSIILDPWARRVTSIGNVPIARQAIALLFIESVCRIEVLWPIVRLLKQKQYKNEAVSIDRDRNRYDARQHMQPGSRGYRTGSIVPQDNCWAAYRKQQS